jgi:hypothetical protein
MRGDLTGLRHTTDRALHDRAIGQDALHVTKDIIYYS